MPQNDEQREYFDKARDIAGYEALSVKAMLQYAYEIRHNPDAIDAASAAWNRNALQFVHAAVWFKKFLDTDKVFTTDFYLSLIQCGRLSKANAALLWDEITKDNLELWQVRERVDVMKQRKPKGEKEQKKCPNCGATL